jgi:hypothetical protein
MKRVERYRTMRVLLGIALVGSVVAVNFAWDAHNDAAMFTAIITAFASLLGILHATRKLGRQDLIMSDHWHPPNEYNPYTGLPMLDGALDVQGNLYGTRSSESHRRGA